MDKKVLAIYYTQSGQMGDIINSFTAPISQAGATVEKVVIKPVEAYTFPWKGNRFFASDADGVFFRLNLDTIFLDARQLDDCQDIVALLEHVDWWKGSLARRLIFQPITHQAAIERPLQVEQGFEGIGESCNHGRTPCCR